MNLLHIYVLETITQACKKGNKVFWFATWAGKASFSEFFSLFFSFKRQRLSIALFFSSFILSTSLDSLERTKLNEITEGPKKKPSFNV